MSALPLMGNWLAPNPQEMSTNELEARYGGTEFYPRLGGGPCPYRAELYKRREEQRLDGMLEDMNQTGFGL